MITAHSSLQQRVEHTRPYINHKRIVCIAHLFAHCSHPSHSHIRHHITSPTSQYRTIEPTMQHAASSPHISVSATPALPLLMPLSPGPPSRSYDVYIISILDAVWFSGCACCGAETHGCAIPMARCTVRSRYPCAGARVREGRGVDGPGGTGRAEEVAWCFVWVGNMFILNMCI